MPTSDADNALTVAVFPGDGIGPEVTAPCIALIEALLPGTGGPPLNFVYLKAGADHYRETGTALPDAELDIAAGADAILLGAMGDPNVRYPDGREITPQIDLREHFGLFAGVRPIITHPGMRVPLADPRGQSLDFVIIRESTEGFFAGRHTPLVEEDFVSETTRITRAGSERLFAFSFELARSRKAGGKPGRVTCVDKANVFKSFGFFRDIFDDVAARYPDIEADHCYVDAAALKLVKQPWDFDVIATENFLGDILSDLGAGLMGGMGMAPSGDIGTNHAVFQPSHGTAPDIVGTGKANPTAMFLSAAMMLDWLAGRFDIPDYRQAAARLTDAVASAFSTGDLVPHEIGGDAGLNLITRRVQERLSG